jgi:hypothetical protein
MLDQIKTGQTVHVKVAKHPTNAAARKTLQRLLAKDPQIAAEEQRRKEVRQATKRLRTRAGRPWISRPVKKRSVVGEPGDAGTLTVSYDVLKDLNSVARFIEVSPAK